MTQWRPALLALLCYAALSWLLLCNGASLSGQIFGYGADPGLIIWFLQWWPWAVSHHALSLHTDLMWHPIGLNLAWTTCVPLLAFLAAPITLIAGPLVAFNLLTLAAPALAAWAAYLLCRGLGALPAPAFFGGLLFGFSSYMAAQSFDHLNLTFCALVPLAVLVAVRRVRGEAGRVATVLGLGLLLGGQFLISEEILATFCLLAALAFVLAYAVERDLRPGLRRLALDIMLAAPLALLPAAPFLLAMAFGTRDISHPADWDVYFSTDALNFIIPSRSTSLGGLGMSEVSKHFTGELDEQGGYLGLPLLLLFAAILFDGTARRRVWLPLTMFALAVLAALGPVLQLGGWVTGFPLPWALVAGLPLLGAALPGRCMIYAFLAAAIIVSLWLSWQPDRLRYFVVVGICVSLLPASHPPQPSPAAAFFRPGRVEQVLGTDPVVLILPFSIYGSGSFWQAENRFGFRQVGGYLGYPPRWAARDPAMMLIFANQYSPAATPDFVRLCRQYQTQYVVAGPKTSAEALSMLASLNWNTQKVDDVIIYTVPQLGPKPP